MEVWPWRRGGQVEMIRSSAGDRWYPGGGQPRGPSAWSVPGPRSPRAASAARCRPAVQRSSATAPHGRHCHGPPHGHHSASTATAQPPACLSRRASIPARAGLILASD